MIDNQLQPVYHFLQAFIFLFKTMIDRGIEKDQSKFSACTAERERKRRRRGEGGGRVKGANSGFKS